MASAAKEYNDDSTDCAICFEPLSDDETITLKCGHRWHLACIREQLAHAQPSKSSRILFSGCRCAKCNVICDHPALENLTRRTDILREKVDELIIEQVKTDAPHEWRKANDDSSRVALLDSARRSYAFYLCGACDEPYFGGTVACADQEEGERTSPEDRLCGACSPKCTAVCENTLEHRAFHVWKCRYCCQPSTFVCYGNIHFCNACHDRNSERDVRKRRGELVAPLDAILCVGENCTFPKKEGCRHHKNGGTVECEQVYYCACCQTRERDNMPPEPPGSRNFIVNPNGAHGTRGWNLQRMQWKVEQIEVPIDNNTTTNFVSSFQWCVMYQSVPLYRYVHNPSSVRIEASAKFMGRTDCPSVFRMELFATNAQGQTIRRISTETMNSPADFWEKATLILEPVAGLHEVTMCIAGKDSRCWRGDYGSKVCHCSVRVLGTEEELESILLGGRGMLFPLLPVSLLGAASAILSFSSISNMIEMYHTVGRHRRLTSGAIPSSSANGPLPILSKAKVWKTVDEAVSELQKMPRRELIRLYLECRSDETFDVFNAARESISYDGYLLDNGPLTHVSDFITNKLFGRGQQWLGKVYFQSNGDDTICTGQNRFICKNSIGGERLDRIFSYYMSNSALSRETTTSQSLVLMNDYSKHCTKHFPASFIWGGMVDELSMIPILKKKRKVILLGMGYFTWSGGPLNAAPFLLVSRDP